MAQGDKYRKGGGAGKKLVSAMKRASANEELASEQSSNIQVGEFVSELATAIKLRMKLGLTDGDWLEEPERYYTDGMCFAQEEATSSSVKLQLTLSLDASTSMWQNNIMRVAGPTFMAIDRIIRKGIEDLPEGAVHYAPFIFHEKAFEIPASLISNYVGRVDWEKGKDGEEKKGSRFETVFINWASKETWEAAIRNGEIPAGTPHGEYKEVVVEDYIGRKSMRRKYVPTLPLSAQDTRLAPLFKAIQDWEERESDSNAVRLDIVITDGVFERQDDIERATRIQEDRNGRLRTVMLNFLPMREWSNAQMPGRCSQYAVTPENLDMSIRTILTETISDLF